ncbi:MAG: thioredoxin-dependent thiol peroxidase [Peptococcaceae bacterium]|jgi:peroxiredoxin Q/BCP|nr:thioredoxin-dependent thiol peroxidase [Peptococcaceae bacterium]
MLEVGMQAPDFALPNEKGELVRLSDFRGKKVVVYFYPKDNTPGCTRQACAFKERYADFQAKDIVVIGISKDSEASHEKFITKYELPFILLADVEKEAIQAYGVWQEKKMYGKVSFGVVRSTFVIDEAGTIIKIYPKAKPDDNAGEILNFLAKE